MKIFYCGIQYDLYDQRRGLSFEHENFYVSLANMAGATTRYFPFDDILTKGRRQWNADLLAAAKDERPDLIFCFMLSDEFEPGVLRQLKAVAPTLAWFSDDHWRFDNYSSLWARHFSWVATTYSKAPGRYRRIGVDNVVRSQWAANTGLYAPTKAMPVMAQRPDVAFVGGRTKPRDRIVRFLRKKGIEVDAYGSGWENGRISEERMIEIFGTAKINLALNPAPGFFNKNSLGRLAFRRSVDKIVFDFHPIANMKTWLHRGIVQIKARHFEIPACGGFVITSQADDLENYFQLGKEMVTYASLPDLAEKIQYYLSHDSEREAIARAGYDRVIRDHTYEKRFSEIFAKIGIHDKF